jgi:hypothetical protein
VGLGGAGLGFGGRGFGLRLKRNPPESDIEEMSAEKPRKRHRKARKNRSHDLVPLYPQPALVSEEKEA